jgi:hypothetical protein
MIIRHKGFDVTVDTIVDRNNIPYKVDHMVVIVKDAISDTAAGAGKATYRYDASDDTWILITKGSEDEMSFITEELTIVSGKVNASYVPAGNGIWDIAVVQGDTIIAFPRIEDILVSGTDITGLELYEGHALRFTYGYGTTGAQITASLENVYTKTESEDLVDNRADLLLNNYGGTKGDIYVADGDGNFQILPKGTDGQVLVADSSEPLGIRWGSYTIG